MTPEIQESARGVVFDVQRYSLQNGPGIRTTVFMKGCLLKCWWCCNPESQSFAPEITRDRALCANCGSCLAACPNNKADGSCMNVSACGLCAAACLRGAKKRRGETRSAKEIADIVYRDAAYYKRSGGGLTISGGECLLQKEFTLELIERVSKACVHTALDTCLHAPADAVIDSIEHTDLYLVDIKHANSAAHKTGTGIGNELIMANLDILLKRGRRIWIRVPVIPGFNDSPDNFRAIAKLLKGAPSVERIELLPGHGMGLKKYEALGREARPVGAPSREALKGFSDILERAGHTVKIRSI